MSVHRINVSEGAAYTRRFREAHPDAIRAHMFNRDILDSILMDPRCVKVRFYNGRTEEGAATLVIVGVDAEGHDLLDAPLGQQTLPCPPICDANSPLMGS
jgi:hypothetical protein